MKGGSRSSSDAGGSIRRTGAGRGTETLLADQLETLEEQGDEFARRIETEKESVRELETKLKRAQERRFEVQREMGGENMPTESVKEQERTTRRLEDRLEKLTVRLNKSVTSNDALRREIDDLRRDRMQRAGVKEKLEQELSSKKEELREVIYASQRAYDARDELQEKIAALRERMAREAREHEAEWKEQVKLLEEESRARGRRQEGDERGAEDGGARPVKRDMRENKAKAMWDIARREVDLQRQRERVRELEDALGKIQRETGIESVDAMVEAFVESEERNFSVITMINELHKEAEGLERECEGMRAQAARLKGEDREADVARRQVFDELQRRVARLKRAADAHRRRHDEASSLVDELKPAVWAIFELVGCDNPTLAAQLATAGVTDSNLLEFMGVIEQRVTEILHMQHLYLSAAPTQMLQEAEALPKSPRVPGGSIQQPTLPTLADMEGDEESEPVRLSALKEDAPRLAAAVDARGKQGTRRRRGDGN